MCFLYFSYFLQGVYQFNIKKKAFYYMRQKKKKGIKQTQNMRFLITEEKDTHFPQLSVISLYTQAPWKCQRNWGKYFYFLIISSGSSPIH